MSGQLETEFSLNTPDAQPAALSNVQLFMLGMHNVQFTLGRFMVQW
jgi:hypothetical protein